MDKLINPFTLLSGPCLVGYVIYKSTIPVEQGGYHLPWWSVHAKPTLCNVSEIRSRNVVISYIVWLSATRTAKLLPHLWHRPQDIIYIPAFILFGYYFAIMKVYALLTLHEVRDLTDALCVYLLHYSQTGWGTRAGIGDPTAATAAADKGDTGEKPELSPQPSSSPRYPEPHHYQQPAVEMQEGYAR